MLLLTRRLILGRHFDVDTCTEITALVAFLNAGRIDLIIVCHTVRDAEVKQVTTTLSASSPATCVLRLSKNGEGIAVANERTRVVKVNSPLTLVDEAQALVADMVNTAAGLTP